MSDYSLMNPDHIRSEISDLEQDLIPEGEALAQRVHEDIDRIFGYLRSTHNEGEPTTLTTEQVKDVIETLANIDLKRYKYYQAEKFAVRVYKNLLTDRRWIIGSKLRFLSK